MTLDFYVGLRDLCNAEIAKHKPEILKDIPESVFSNFKYQQRTSDKMGKYEVAEQENNDPQKFAEALDILTAHKATIKERFHLEGYIFAYWEFQGRIYRAQLKQR